jgi:hypothetical protein
VGNKSKMSKCQNYITIILYQLKRQAIKQCSAYEIYEPGHGIEVQLISWYESSVQFVPPYIGTGLLHSRYRLVEPRPQTGHAGVHSDHTDQPPFTENSYCHRALYQVLLLTEGVAIILNIVKFKALLQDCIIFVSESQSTKNNHLTYLSNFVLLRV